MDETDTLGRHSNEAGVNGQVERGILDIPESIGVRGKVTVCAEVKVMSNRLHFMLILSHEQSSGFHADSHQ